MNVGRAKRDSSGLGLAQGVPRTSTVQYYRTLPYAVQYCLEFNGNELVFSASSAP